MCNTCHGTDASGHHLGGCRWQADRGKNSLNTQAPAGGLTLHLADYDNASSLIYGIGNIGRQDDGLGWAFIDWLEQESVCPEADLMRHYQLHLEDADLISYKSKVLFVDATKAADVESFRIEKMAPKMDFSFSSHTISIPAIMATCQQCFDTVPEVHLLTIRGYAWELEQGLTLNAEKNLMVATVYFSQLLIDASTGRYCSDA